MAEYTTIARVSAELNGFTLNASSTPSSSDVSQWITDASEQVDLMTETVWGSTTVSSEYYDYDGSGILRLENTPIIAVSSLLWESSGINATATWGSLTEGRLATNSFIVYKEEGELQFHGNTKPSAGYQNICVSYTHGYASIPVKVADLTTKIAAQRVIKTIVDGSATNEGGTVSVGTISVSDPSNFGNERLRELDNEIKSLSDAIGRLKTYKITRRGD